MRILWLCNIMMPFIAKELGMEASSKEGWLTGTIDRILREEKEVALTIGVCFPVQTPEAVVTGEVTGVSYYGFCEDINHAELYDETLEVQLRGIVEEFQPDVIHIFGTEFAHSYAMVRAVDEKEKIIVGIQGICTLCAEEYFANLPRKVVQSKTFRDFIKKDTLILQQEKFAMRAERERLLLKEVVHVLGRTKADYDYMCSINPKSIYHKLHETLRDEFYHGAWKLSECRRNTILVTQADYPLKGFHLLIRALPDLIEQFPDLQVQVTGNRITNWSSVKDKIKIGAYGNYIRKLIRQNKLEEHITFLGMVNGEEMRTIALGSHLLVNCSSMENSPNSVGEAMLLGVPVVASRVGGVPSMIEHEVEGLLYQAYDQAELVQCISRMLGDDQLAIKLSETAKERAKYVHEPSENYKRLMEIYKEVAGINEEVEEETHDNHNGIELF